jgi:hypothetical protein
MPEYPKTTPIVPSGKERILPFDEVPSGYNGGTKEIPIGKPSVEKTETTYKTVYFEDKNLSGSLDEGDTFTLVTTKWDGSSESQTFIVGWNNEEIKKILGDRNIGVSAIFKNQFCLPPNENGETQSVTFVDSDNNGKPDIADLFIFSTGKFGPSGNYIGLSEEHEMVGINDSAISERLRTGLLQLLNEYEK